MSKAQIKFCGLTRAADVQSALALGVDFLGFVCVPSSKRYITASDAKALLRLMRAPARSVGLFQNQAADAIHAVLRVADFDVLQFHGAETQEFCMQFNKPFIKAVPMLDKPDLQQMWRQFSSAEYLLLDAHSLAGANPLGGTGQRFAWDDVQIKAALPAAPAPALMLAGGLNPENLCAAVRQCGPAAVDVSSGIESSAGIKSEEKMRAFITSLRRCEDNLRHSSKTS
jgi:phosphoribosylanthranilate isomerase